MGRFFQKGIISIWNHLQQHCLLEWSPDWPGDCLGPPLEVNKYIQRLIGMKLLETVDWWGPERSALLLQHRYLSLEQGTSGTNYGTVHVLCSLHRERLSPASRVHGACWQQTLWKHQSGSIASYFNPSDQVFVTILEKFTLWRAKYAASTQAKVVFEMPLLPKAWRILLPTSCRNRNRFYL